MKLSTSAIIEYLFSDMLIRIIVPYARQNPCNNRFPKGDNEDLVGITIP